MKFMRLTLRTLVFVILLAGFLLFESDLAIGDPELDQKLSKFVTRRSKRLGKQVRLGIVVADADTGEYLFSYQKDRQLIPASVQKIVTSVTALQVLGAQYRFPLEVFVDSIPGKRYSEGSHNPLGEGHVGNLYFRGYGDPSLIEENLWRIVRDLKELYVHSVADLVIDDTLYVDPPGPTGWKAYQAGKGAISLNHNCYAVRIWPGKVGALAKVAVTEGLGYVLVNKLKTVSGRVEQITIKEIPIAAKRKDTTIRRGSESLDLPKKKIIVEGKIGAERGKEEFYRTVPSAAAYFGAMLQHLLKKEGIRVSGRVVRAETPAEAKRLAIFRSKDLGLIIRDLNRYSNNFIAGQLVYALGQDESGRFYRNSGLNRIASYLKGLGFADSDFSVHDGSGLNKKNRLTAEQVVKVLVTAYRDFSLSPDFISSMSRFGYSGTLKDRNLNDHTKRGHEEIFSARQARSIWAKTGTLEGVSTLAGYATTNEDARVAFAILINRHQSKVEAMDFEEEFLRILAAAN